MSGDPTDNNAKLFAQGYNGVLKPHFDDGSYTKVGAPAGTWDAPTAATTFEQQYTAHPNINAVVMPNDNTANAVISVLLKNKIPANTFPVTGQDAATDGLQNILKGYQCGTVYKPNFAEAQAAVGARALPQGRQDAAVLARERHDAGHDAERGHQVRVHEALLGDEGEHGRHGRQGRADHGVRPLRRQGGQRV